MASISRLSNSILRTAYATPKGVRLGDNFEKALVDDIFACAVRKQTGVSLKYMLDFGSKPIERQLVLSAQFLHNELPVRLAHRVAELENLPYGLSAKPHVLKVRDWYVDSFKDLRNFPKVRDAEDELKFTELLRNIYSRHQNVVPVMAMGVAELKRELSSNIGLKDLPDIHQFLDGFYMSRIGLRMLIGQHVALKEPQKESHIGLIDTKCSPGVICSHAIDDARAICMREKGDAPQVVVYGDPKFTFPYIPSHLHHIVFELVKNSLRAVYDRFEDEDCEPPPIRVIIAEGEEDITIKCSDEGGGIARSGLSKIWTYLYSTAKSPLEELKDVDGAAESPSVLAGYGYGLPISRLYARYFGGDLQIISMEGYGTDSYCHVNRLGNASEPLP